MKRNMIHIGLAIAGLSALAAFFSSCQGRTAENVEPTGDTVEVNIKPEAGDTEKADTVLHAMDDQMLHSLDAEQIMTTSRI